MAANESEYVLYRGRKESATRVVKVPLEWSGAAQSWARSTFLWRGAAYLAAVENGVTTVLIDSKLQAR